MRAGPILLVAAVVLRAQEARLGLNGIFDIGSTNSRSAVQPVQNPAFVNNSTNLDWGLDLNIRTYILDPRFITLTLEPSVHRGGGRTDQQQQQDADFGGSFYLDFLKNTFYPFRFHFIDHSLSYVREHLNSASVARRSLGFDWTLRLPKRPAVFVNYDNSRFDYEFTLTPATVTRTSNLLVATQATSLGWSTNAAFSHQSSTQAFSGLGTTTDLIRGTANRKIWSDSQLSVNAVHERLRLLNQPGAGGVDIGFASIRTDLRTRHSEKLSTTFSHQYYGTESSSGSDLTSLAGPRFETGSVAFNDLAGTIAYRLSSSLSVGGSSGAAFVSTPSAAIEAPATTINTSGNVNWQRRLKFLQTRATYVQGISYANSNRGNSHDVPFETATAGLSVGDSRWVLLAADGMYSKRPEVFEIGGSFTQRDLTASLETRRAGLTLRAAGGINEFDYLTLRGHERFRTKTYSLHVSKSIFSLTASRNANVSLRNLLAGSSAVAPPELFVTLPVATLVNAPLFTTTSVYTTGVLSVRPRKRFEFDARYLRDRILFTGTSNVLLRQYEVFGSYRLGKFTVTAGLLYLGDTTQNVAHHERRYFFFRILRPFRIV